MTIVNLSNQDSLKHACKVPNTEQPFACIDLMFLATLLDKMLGMKQVGRFTLNFVIEMAILSNPKSGELPKADLEDRLKLAKFLA